MKMPDLLVDVTMATLLVVLAATEPIWGWCWGRVVRNARLYKPEDEISGGSPRTSKPWDSK